MPSRLDAASAADGSLRRRLEQVMDDAADHPLSESLRELAAAAATSLGCGFAAVRLTDPGSDDTLGEQEPDLVVAAGSETRSPDDAGLIRVPIVLRGASRGELLLAAAPGVDAFDLDEQRRADAVASAAGIVIERVRTAEANRLREQWHEGGVALAKDIVALRHENPYDLIVDRVVEIARGESASILQLGKTEDSYVVVAGNGPLSADWVGREIVVQDAITERVMATGRPMHVSRLADVALPGDMRAQLTDDSVAVIPLLGSGAQQGVIVITRNPQRPPMSQAEMGMATAFAGTVALALELAESQAQRDELVLVEERDRIARDLHDHVIQRLYAIGLSMQSVANSASGVVEERLISSVDEIDETIKQIRTTIFRLTTPLISSRRSLRARAEALLDDLTPALGFRPRLVSHGPVDFGVDEDIVDDCDAVLREAVTNVARHAQATEAEIAINVSAAQLRLEIRDNGVGLGDTDRRSGLANLRARAESHDGFMQVRSAPGDGTWLLWSIPLVAEQRA
ncbi:GAF domain-containing protein [Jatrophihabitans endophyticus]|uniref:GAF domain-containing sensor histidine kinase n=1 Tax=Jatrophihabitans endophyticus TaxID=1206085 RepID=UPI0019FC4BD1|nr:GAF domain-containing protein [Jatrophihabitans endophyticus]MBE7187968.1 GAF domain-containing protein [Jatrophihabitans endophyticus]